MRPVDGLIDALVADAQPIRRAAPPLRRALVWLALAASVIGLLAVLHGLRPDLPARLRQPAFCLSLGATLATGASAAVAAMLVSLPDRSRAWLLLPLPAALIWVGGIGYGCLCHWVPFDPGGVAGAELRRCAATVLASSVPLSALMLWLLRHAARLGGGPALLAGSLAVAALTAAALSLLHEFDASLMILAWNLGAALLVFTLDAAIGRRVLRVGSVVSPSANRRAWRGAQ
jgi:hypothetical protein